ncbi:aminopeptidase P family protein RNJ42_02314 [Nakaseomyces bracarensis]|uniref:aminopeptidase P family protein n=1 Tax=Nakaseomyces bracarensis TaxID=273131 RepID=UPI0038724A7B
MGPNDVPETLKGQKYPAKAHMQRVRDILLEKRGDLKSEDAAVFIAGEEVEGWKYCDTDRDFRQNRYFYYLSGCDIPGSALLYNFKKDKLCLFLPNIDWDDVIWSGMPQSLEEVAKMCDVDEVFHMKQLDEVLNEQLEDISNFKIFTTDLDNVHNDKLKSNLIPGDKDFFFALDEARLIKDWYELEVLRNAARITDKCHLAVMSALPIELNEIQIEAEFSYHALRQGARSLGYDPICCSGPACGTLHYIKNSEDLAGKSSILIDAGAEWKQYTSDVTRCFPINGKFTKEHRAIYEAVLDMQSQAMEQIKPGASWDDLHILTHKVLIKHLLKLGVFKKEFSEEEIFERRVTCAFYPHGLGHVMGLDVHDTAGRPNYEDPDPYFKFLRLRRKLEKNMVITNEPGCYFNEFLIEEFLKKFPERVEVVDQEVLKKYMYVGGVRIEDDIIVTETGYENMTGITSDPDEIEKIVSQGLAKKRSEFHALV